MVINLFRINYATDLISNSSTISSSRSTVTVTVAVPGFSPLT